MTPRGRAPTCGPTWRLMERRSMRPTVRIGLELIGRRGSTACSARLKPPPPWLVAMSAQPRRGPRMRGDGRRCGRRRRRPKATACARRTGERKGRGERGGPHRRARAGAGNEGGGVDWRRGGMDGRRRHLGRELRGVRNGERETTAVAIVGWRWKGWIAHRRARSWSYGGDLRKPSGGRGSSYDGEAGSGERTAWRRP